MGRLQQNVDEQTPMNNVITIPVEGLQSTAGWPEPPRLLVEWSSRWDEFKSALGPAMVRAPKPLAGEAPIGIFPYRGMLVSWALEILLLIAIIVLPGRFSDQQISTLPKRQQFDVIYYSGDELPQTSDRGGAQAGESGRAGGQQAHHRTQAIPWRAATRHRKKLSMRQRSICRILILLSQICLRSKQKPGRRQRKVCAPPSPLQLFPR
jgi:hypothetical protein